MAKKQAKPVKTPIAHRMGSFIGRHGPGTAKKLGRATKRGADHAKNFAEMFGKSFMEGLRDS